MKWSEIFLALLFSLGFLMASKKSNAIDKIYRYVITETGGPTSFDPLDADNTTNLPVARMIYATPLEISGDNQLSSYVLESFSYDRATRTIKWLVRTDVKFEDGTPITSSDVAFAVARMAFTRPQFPVVENIEGVEKWSKSKGALKSLPKGIVVNGQSVSIKLMKDIEHPLFRFCLELFSIIPKSCVDLENNKINCKKIPASGYYNIADQTKEQILFVKRNDLNSSKPDKIRFEYISPEQLPKKFGVFDGMTVFQGNEASYPVAEISSIEKNFSTKFTPASRFSILLLNPTVAPFNEKKCRQFFAKAFRESYAKLTGTSQLLEASIFAKVLPGYLSMRELSEGGTLSDKDISLCKSRLKKLKINWGYAKADSSSVFVETLKETFDQLEIKTTAPMIAPNRKDLTDMFVEGKISFFNGNSGFWALDPSGDLKMLFTPNLHKPLSFVSVDDKLQKMIAEINGGKSKYEKVNRYLYGEALFNVYTHLRRFFASPNKELLVDVPFAITSPAPWQVFKVN